MPAGVSSLWATPSRPESHFSEEELADSDRYHRPLRRAGLLGLSTKVLLLCVAAVVGGFAANRWGWRSWPLATRAIVGSSLTVGAMRLPAIVVDAWFEFRHRPAVDPDGGGPIPPLWFAGVAAVLTGGSILLVATCALIAYPLAARVERWPLVVSALMTGAMVAFAVGEGSIRRLTGRETTIPDDGAESDSVVADVMALVDQVGLSGVDLRRRPAVGVADQPGWRPGVIEGVNAYATGFGPNRRVVVSDALLDEHPDTVRFVVAHELTHLVRRHLVVQAVLGMTLAVSTLLMLGVAAERRWPWSLIDADALDPLGLPVVALLVLAAAAVSGPVNGWVGRTHERVADRGAISAVGALPDDLARRLHITVAADLDPPWWVRLYTSHPSPSERLEFLSRHR